MTLRGIYDTAIATLRPASHPARRKEAFTRAPGATPAFAEEDAAVSIGATYPAPRGAAATQGSRRSAVLNVDSIDLHYGHAQALRGVSLTAEIGKVTTVLGRNGVGKTSLLRAIVGQQPISGGVIRWNGEDISKLPAVERARRGIAVVPQGREIFPLLTVKENLQTGHAVLPRALRTLPEEILELFPVLGDMLGRRGGDLSGGQQQQLAIARALVMRPKLLVLDEPTEGIQPSIIKDIGRAITYLRNAGSMAIVLVEQYYEFARDLADTYAVLDRGQVVLAGARSELNEADVRRRLAV
jgi:urea transport system ATP-binding protein